MTVVVLYMYCMQCFVLIKIVTVSNTRIHPPRLVSIGYKYTTGCHDNCNVGLHVCARFHEHTYTVLYAHSKGIR